LRHQGLAEIGEHDAFMAEAMRDKHSSSAQKSIVPCTKNHHIAYS
jgi:hypothetical protein